ncbi:MAG: hypothetical protein LBS55_11800, partial [Prevotellaceae bacterium]|nr:hypothetical protein [Prevotellaceae bacterium]
MYSNRLQIYKNPYALAYGQDKKELSQGLRNKYAITVFRCPDRYKMLVENVCLTPPPPPSRQGRNAGVFQHIPSLRNGTSGGGSVETVHAP